MNRRTVLQGVAALALPGTTAAAAGTPLRRVRPGDPGWPSAAQWDALNAEVGGSLFKVRSPLADCAAGGDETACQAVLRELKNPYYINATAGLTQTTGWVDAWASAPSAYGVAARGAADVAAAVNFAREHSLRLVVKGGGHAYQGTSNAADSLLIWTRPMDAVALHDGFVPEGCGGAPLPAVTVGAGAIWLRVYNAVATGAGRYVQGGGCLTVGVAGLVLGGGFGSFSKTYGMAAASLLEAEVVTADGRVRIANACTNPDLFWGLKGGGGGSLGVVTRLTLRTHDLPASFGAVFLTIRAASGDAYRRLVGRFVGFYAKRLFNPHWGESVAFGRDNVLRVSMLSNGLDRAEMEETWHPFLDFVAASPDAFSLAAPPVFIGVPPRDFWNPARLLQGPGIVLRDDRPGAPEDNVFWASNLGEAGWFLHGYESAWMPASLLREGEQARLAEALFAASRQWYFQLHFNKGLAGAPPEAVAAARDTATNPAVVEAFALAISAAYGPPAVPGLQGHAPDVAGARQDAAAIHRAMDALRAVAPDAGSYFSESDFFAQDWQREFWGANYPRLAAVKRRYDPDGLFFVHHGVGSEGWSADGFERPG